MKWAPGGSKRADEDGAGEGKRADEDRVGEGKRVDEGRVGEGKRVDEGRVGEGKTSRKALAVGLTADEEAASASTRKQDKVRRRRAGCDSREKVRWMRWMRAGRDRRAGRDSLCIFVFDVSLGVDGVGGFGAVRCRCR